MNNASSSSGNVADNGSDHSAPQHQGQPKQKGYTKKKNLGVALVGLGSYSEKQLAPALKETKHCDLVGVVSGDSEKLKKWSRQYNLKEKNLYGYDNFDNIKSNDDIDIVYIVLPNSMHAEFVIRGAEAGKHVICEKPMANNIEDCERMIEVCREAGVKLSMGYRLHFDPFNLEMMRLGQNNLMGRCKRIVAKNGMDVVDKNQWRLSKVLAGGGPLMDVGIYCVQGVLYTLGELPTSVHAKFHPKKDKEKFATVEEGLEWEMEFPGGVKAFCETSYSKAFNILRAETERGWFELNPAYEYNGLKGDTSDGPMKIQSINQQAAQMDDFARCIITNEPTRLPGEMGLRDMHILLSIYESAITGRKIPLELGAFKHLIET
ncbi:MAG: Gfo/Idh/MocA family oxidoreductase [Cyclobacteriaceae bacterium]